VKKLSSQIDGLLEPLLLATSAEKADEILSQLITEQAGPVINGVLRYKLRSSSGHGGVGAEIEDLRQEAIAQLLAELQKVRSDAGSRPISDVRGLAATITYRLCARWMRRQFPEHHALRNRIQYLLTRQAGFALWPKEAEEKGESKKLVAGYAAWRGEKAPIATASLRGVLQDEKLFASFDGRRESAKLPAKLNDLLAAIFNRVGAPVEFDELIKTVASILQIKDQAPESVDADPGDGGFELADKGADISWQVEKRIFLQRLWEEVRQLPRGQRVALLLNLRDPEGRGCLALFPATGVATLRQIGLCLELSMEQLAELWNEAPIEDARIAELLQITRQQVINARKSARERLARRLKGFI
jgi:DNA-directed RNA polymerase specialized sigma24 family protein